MANNSRTTQGAKNRKNVKQNATTARAARAQSTATTAAQTAPTPQPITSVLPPQTPQMSPAEAAPRPPRQKLDKSTKLIIIITGAVAGALLIMALIWGLVANFAATPIARVVYQTSSTKYDETDRAKMNAVADALQRYGVGKGDKVCLNYTDSYASGYSSSSSYYNYGSDYSATIYWRDGTKQTMNCTAKNASLQQMSRIDGLRAALRAALNDSGANYRYRYEPYSPYPYDLYNL